MKIYGRSVGVVLSILFLSLLSAGCGKEENILYPVESSDSFEASEEISETQDTEENRQMIFVYLCGAVQNPGVYEVPEGTRLFEVLKLAGGMTADASDSSLNQAEKLNDGQLIRVLTHDEEASENEGINPSGDKADSRVNINTADEAELTTITGIGSSRAQAIIAWREEHGSFKTIEDIMNVSGIKEGLFSRIRDSIRVS